MENYLIDLYNSPGYKTHMKHWETYWADYRNEFPVENMRSGQQYTLTCGDFRRGLKEHVRFLRTAAFDRSQDILYMSNMQRLLGVIVDVAKRMNIEDSQHPAVLNRGVDHWDKEFELLCDKKLVLPMQKAFELLAKDNRHWPSAEVDYEVAGILQRVLGIANFLLSNDKLPKGFGHREDSTPSVRERLSEAFALIHSRRDRDMDDTEPLRPVS